MRGLIKTLKSKFWCLSIVTPLMVLPLIGCSKALTEMEENVLKVWSAKEGNDKLYSWYLQKIYTNLNNERNSNIEDADFIKGVLYSNATKESETYKLNKNLKKYLNFILRQEIKNSESFLNNLFYKLSNTTGGLNNSIISKLKDKIISTLEDKKSGFKTSSFWGSKNGGPRNKLDHLFNTLENTEIRPEVKNVAANIYIEESSKEWYNHSDIKKLINDHKDTTYADLFLWLVMSNPGNELDIKIWHMAIVDNFLSRVTEKEFKDFWTDKNKNKSYESYVEDLDTDNKHWLLNRRLLVEKLMLHWKLDLDSVKDKAETDEEIRLKHQLEKYEYDREKFYKKDNKFNIETFIQKHFVLESPIDKEKTDLESLISFIRYKYKKYETSHINKNDFWTYKDFGLDILNNSKNLRISEKIKEDLMKPEPTMYGFAGIGEIPKSNDQWFDYNTKNITKKIKYQNLELAGILHKPDGKDNYNLITENEYEWPTIKQKDGKDNKETTGVVQYMIGLMPRYTKDNKKLTLEGTFLEGKEAELRMILGTREEVIKEALNYYEFKKKIKLEVPNILLNKIDWVTSWTKNRMKKDVNYKELSKGSANRKPYEQGFLPYDWSYITNKDIEDLIK